MNYNKFIILLLIITYSCTPRQIIENTNRIKNAKSLSKEGIKEEIIVKTKRNIEKIGR
tara:strand:+ start:69 stop:242 length:174 start_codon:yes stop_codon:yes gene_type:complete